mmetsp:Transcript_20182/g.50400  ORF Transcript_20182/g.50400 Transcript_20182/m.50400 type:complete len:94 (+) Transcript_20182:77-358(+)
MNGRAPSRSVNEPPAFAQQSFRSAIAYHTMKTVRYHVNNAAPHKQCDLMPPNQPRSLLPAVYYVVFELCRTHTIIKLSSSRSVESMALAVQSS